MRQCHHWVRSLQPHLPCHAGVPLSAFGYFPALVTMYSLRKTKENKREQKTGKKKRDHLGNGHAASQEWPAWNPSVVNTWKRLPGLLLTCLCTGLICKASASQAEWPQLNPCPTLWLSMAMEGDEGFDGQDLTIRKYV